MTPSRTTLRVATSTVSAAVLATTVLAGAPATAEAATPESAPTAAASGASASVRFVDIKGDGGITLKANVFTPAGADGTRRYPVIVLPTSWSMPQIEYMAQAKKLAEAGYVVVGYNSRGFWQSGGEIETAGPKDVADASKVIDWALAHTTGRPAEGRHGRGLLRRRDQPAGVRVRQADQGGCGAQRLGRPHRLDLQRPHPAPPGGGVPRRHGRADRAPQPRTPDDPQGLPRLRSRQGKGHDRVGEEALPQPPTSTRSTPMAPRSCWATPGATPSSRPTSTPTSTRS